MAELDVRIKLRRGDFQLDVAFTAPPGVTILFGPSGAGKSTTLQAIAGLLRPDDGKIALDDEVWFDAARRGDRAVHHRGVGYVFQSSALFPHLSALENVAYGIDRRLDETERRRRAAAMLERFHATALSDRRPASLSGGEAQRVAVARALAMKPRVLLLDEPFAALDREAREALAADLRTLVVEARIPTVHVTHDQAEAKVLGKRTIRLEAGRSL